MMGTEKRAGMDWRICLPLAVAATIVLRLIIAADPPFAAVYTYLLALPYAAFAYPAVMEARAKRIPGFGLLAIGFVFAFALCVFSKATEEQTADGMVYLLMLLFAGCVCYPMAFLLPEARAKNALTGLAGLFVGLMTLLSLLGVVAACTGNVIPSLAGAAHPGIGSPDGRLYAYLYPSAFALATGLALLLAPYLFGSTEKKSLRILLVVAAALLYFGMALTGATVSQLVFAVCAGGFVFLVANARLAGKKAIARVLLALVLAAVAVGVCFGGQWAVRRAVNAIAPAPAPVSAATALPHPPATTGAPAAQDLTRRLAMPHAVRNAETVAQPVELGFVALRVTLWRATGALFSENPTLLFTGTTPMRMAERLAPYLPAGVPGTNMRFLPMQALVAYGVPGLLLTLAFAAYALYHAVRLFFRGCASRTLLERSLTLVPLFCLLLDCTDCYLTLTDAGGLSSLWFFLTAGYVVCWSKERAPE